MGLLGLPLSPAQAQILNGVLAGDTLKEIAGRRGCKESTVATHLMKIRKKWGVAKASRGAVLAEYIRRREALLQRALSLINGECPGRSAPEKDWLNWSYRCSVLIAEAK